MKKSSAEGISRYWAAMTPEQRSAEMKRRQQLAIHNRGGKDWRRGRASTKRHHSHLSVVGSKVNGTATRKLVGFHKLKTIKAELERAIAETSGRLEKLRFAQQLLEDGRL
jgi:hypothetical protein